MVKGTITDSTNHQPVRGVTITVISSQDSTLLWYGTSKESGSFQLDNIPFGRYVLVITHLGFAPSETPFSLSDAKPVFNAGTIYLVPVPKVLEEVVVRSTPLSINGDTTDFRASHFKTIPNATTEDLLKKLPGIEVERDGTIRAQGETVTRILVDGKRFFGNDPKTATRNLPADIIEKIQLIDAQSEQSEFSGFDDGERVRTINIVTKKDRKKGWFGKGSVAVGDQGRRANAVSAHRFDGNQQTSFIAQSNNINNQNFTVQDFLGNTGGGGGGRGGRGGGGANIFSGNASGISTTYAGGLNYNDAWSSKTMANGSYFFNKVEATNNRDRYRETFVADDSSLFNTNRLVSTNKNTNHRFNFEIDHRFDSMNSVLIRPDFSYQENSSNSSTNSITTRGKLLPLNDVRSVVTSDSRGYNFSNSVLLRHRFRKRGRTFSMNLTQALNENDRAGRNFSLSTKRSSEVDTLDQISSTVRDGKSLGANVSFTDRMGTRSQVELSYNYNYNANNSDQQTYRWNKASGGYDAAVPNLTNLFQNTQASQRAGFNYRMQLSPEWNYAIGMAVQHAELTSHNLSKDALLQQSFNNLFPTFNLQYRRSRTKNFRLTYRGRTNQPGLTQLQDVIDNSNILHIRSGNPALTQEFTNTWNVHYNTFNPTTYSNWFMSLNASTTANKISNTHFINTTPDTITVDDIRLGPGVQFSKPRNLNGALQAGGTVQYSFPVKKLQSTIRLNTRFNYDRDVNLVNEVLGYTRNYVLGGGVRATMNLKDRLDLNLSGNLTYNLVRYSLDAKQNGDYYTQRFSLEPTYTTRNGWILTNDFDYVANRGQASGFNRSVPLWNAGIARLFLKKKQAELRLTVFDLLSQNKNISRAVEQNYIEDVRTQVLNRYFLLSFTYHLRKFKGPQPMKNRTGERRIREEQ